MTVLGGTVLAVASALLAAWIADQRQQPVLVWFLVGLVFPLVGVVIALVGLRDAAAPAAITVQDAARASSVAAALAALPDSSPQELSRRTRLPDRETWQQLVALRRLGLARMRDDGRWHLTAEGRDARA